MSTSSTVRFSPLSHGVCFLTGALLAGAIILSITTAPPPSTQPSQPPMARSAAHMVTASDPIPASSDLEKQLADQAKALALAQAELEKTKKALAAKENALDGANSYISALIDDSLKQTDAEVKSGAKNSSFSTIDESSLFLGQLNKRYADFHQRFPQVPAPGTPERAEYDKELAALASDTQTILADSRLIGAFKSADANVIAHSMALQMQSEMDLNAGQVVAVNSILNSAYTEGFSQHLNAAGKPSGDSTAWQNARTNLQSQTDAQIQAILTPAQRAYFNRGGGPNQMWNLNIGG